MHLILNFAKNAVEVRVAGSKTAYSALRLSILFRISIHVTRSLIKLVNQFQDILYLYLN